MQEIENLDKIKVRVSGFVYVIVKNDAETFGFFNRKNKPNISGFLNKLIPNMLRLRQVRRENIYSEIMFSYEDLTENEIDKIQTIIDQVVDRVYFPDAALGTLTKDFWIRPVKKTKLAFQEIVEEEVPYLDSYLSTYLRSLLNEYCKLPQYKREMIVFDWELEQIYRARNQGRELHILANGQKISGVPVEYVYGFAQNQQTYVFLYDVVNHKIVSLLLKDIRDIYVTQKEFTLGQEVFEKMQEIYKGNLFLGQEEFEV